MNLDLLADQIRQRINEGSDILKSNSATRAYVDAALRPHEKLRRILIASPEKLMAELTKWIIQSWPQEIPIVRQIEQYLKPIGEISKILCRKNFNNDVLIPDGGRRIEDARMPKDEFKKALLQKIFKASR